MFKFLESVVKAAAVVVTLPVAAATDIVTLGGVLQDRDNSHTADALNDFVKNVADLGKPSKD